MPKSEAQKLLAALEEFLNSMAGLGVGRDLGLVQAEKIVKDYVLKEQHNA
jgi:hypothetical protein